MDFLFLFLFAIIPAEDSQVSETPTEIKTEQVEISEETDPLVELLNEKPVIKEDNKTEENNTLTNSSMTPEKDLQKGAVQDTETVAVITTNYGEIVLRFFPEEAPKTVENFTGLAKKEYYNGIIFHRIIDGFMLQGGDPTGTGTGGESLWGGKFEDEFSDDVKNNRGSISMANAGAGTNGSQFFINTVNNNFLDNRHSVFGEVISGMETVDKISKVETAAGDKPKKDVIMEKVEVMTFAEYKNK